MRKNRVVYLLTALLSMFLLSACGPAVATDGEIQEEISNFEHFDDYGVTITSYEEIMRKTSSEDRYDVVEVSIVAENDMVEIQGDYYLEYRKYDNGWILEYINRCNAFYTVKEEVAGDVLDNDILLLSEKIKSDYALDNIETEEPVLWDYDFTSDHGTPYCIYYVSTYGENQHARVEEDIYLYYEFDVDIGWWRSETQSYFVKKLIEPKGEPSELLAEETLKTYGYEDYQLSKKTPDGITYQVYSYLAKDSATYKYMTVYYAVDITFQFSPWYGWTIFNVDSSEIDREINATGRWVYDDGKGKQKYIFDIMTMDENEVTYQCEITVTDKHLCISEHTWSGTTGGKTRKKEWERTSKEGYCLRTTDWTASCDPVVLGNETICYYLEFRSYSGDRYDESGFYFNDCLLTKVS